MLKYLLIVSKIKDLGVYIYVFVIINLFCLVLEYVVIKYI